MPIQFIFIVKFQCVFHDKISLSFNMLTFFPSNHPFFFLLRSILKTEFMGELFYNNFPFFSLSFCLKTLYFPSALTYRGLYLRKLNIFILLTNINQTKMAQRVNLYFLTLLLLTTLIMSKITIDTSKFVIQSNNEWTRIYLIVGGGFAPYQFTFVQMAKDWKGFKNTLILPNKALQTNRKYPVCLIIKDQLQDQINATLLFIVKDRKIYIDDQVRPMGEHFDDQFFNEEGFSGKPELILLSTQPQRPRKKRESSKNMERSLEQSRKMVATVGSGIQNILQILGADEQNEGDEIRKLKKMISSKQEEEKQKPISSIFTGLPSVKDIDQIILQSDSFVIFRTIQSVIRKESLNCRQKIAYLSQIFGRIQNAIKIKEFTASQIKIIIEGAKSEIKRLKNEIEKVDSEIKKLEIESLQSKVELELVDLEKMYDRYNENYEQIENQKAYLKKVYKKLENTERVGDLKRQEINKKELELNQAIFQITKIELQLQQAKKYRNRVEEELQQLKTNLRSIQFSIDLIKRRVQEVEFRIQQLRDKSDSLKNRYSSIEITVERLKKKIKKTIRKQAQLFNLKDSYMKKIQIQQSKIADRQLYMLKDFIHILANTVPNVQQEINKLAYYCSKSKYSSKIKNGKILYLFQTQDFLQYIFNAYGYKISLKNPQQHEVSLINFHILEYDWIRAFGQPFSDSVIAKSSSFNFEDDFNCLNPSALVNGSGRITSISKKTITVTTKEETELRLKLSSCTRLQSVGGELPQINSTIYWKGNQEARSIEVYEGTYMN